MTTETIIRRLHVGGITPNITSTHIKDRFSIFGTVKDIEELKPNALGDPRPFTFLTLETTPKQLTKCLNIMSGSTWRGTTLRLAEAKLKYNDRLVKERNPDPQAVKLRIDKKRKRAMRQNAQDGLGKESQDMRVPTLKNYINKKYWSVDSGRYLIRPLSMRPSRPIPSSTIPDAMKSAVVKDERPRLPPKRARRRVFNPADWQPLHFAFERSEMSQDGLHDEWEYEDLEDDVEEDVPADGDGDRVKIGIWKRTLDGEVLDEEIVYAKRRRVELDEGFMDLASDIEIEDDGSELFGPRHRTAGTSEEDGEARSRSSSPLFGGHPVQLDQSPSPEAEIVKIPTRSPSPLFPTHARTVGNARTPSPPPAENPPRSSSPAEDGSSPIFPGRLPSPSLSPSQSPSASRSTPITTISPLLSIPDKLTEPPAPPRSKVDIPQPLLATVRAERSRDLQLLQSMLGPDGEYHPLPPKSKGKSEWAGFNESDEEDEDVAGGGVLRLRGGAGSEVESSDETDSGSEEGDSDSEESSDSSEESTSEGSSSTGSTDAKDETMKEKLNGTTNPNGTTKSTSLKDMFAPSTRAKDTNGFSLFADLDLELEESSDIPLVQTQIPTSTPSETLQPLPPKTTTGIFELDPSAPLFFAIPSLPIGEQDGEVKGFWREETDDEMKVIWEKDRLELTREWKRRYRDARKQKRRRGGDAEME